MRESVFETWSEGVAERMLTHTRNF